MHQKTRIAALAPVVSFLTLLTLAAAAGGAPPATGPAVGRTVSF